MSSARSNDASHIEHAVPKNLRLRRKLSHFKGTVARLWPMDGHKHKCKQRKRPAKPLNSALLRELGLNYVARFATSSGKLEAYLRRKLRERGWEDDGEADISGLVNDFARHGYFDDEAYARARSGDLLRRGYGARRVGEALRHAGIDEDIRETVAPPESAARHAALRLAQKRRFGPFALEAPERDKLQKQLAAMLRAGHSLEHARRVLEAATADDAQDWASELDEENDYGL